MNPFVLAWTLISASGVVLSSLLLMESVFDVRSLKGVGNGRVLHARGRIATEFTRLIIHSGFLAIGLLALDSPARGSLTVYVLITANALLVLNSMIAWWVRRAAGEYSMTAAELEAEAIETALKLRITAEKAAQRLLDLAAQTAATGVDPGIKQAIEQTAENTEQIARNTERNE